MADEQRAGGKRKIFDYMIARHQIMLPQAASATSRLKQEHSSCRETEGPEQEDIQKSGGLRRWRGTELRCRIIQTLEFPREWDLFAASV